MHFCNFKSINKIIFLGLFSMILSGCGTGFFKPDWSKTAEPDGKERARNNVREGKGIDFGIGKKSGGDFLFASSNPMWRASLETLDFLPLSTVDYSGGVIITDWYSDVTTDESLKITIRFLSNEIRSDSLKIIVHKKKCNTASNCITNVSKSNIIKDELRSTILRKAALIEKSIKK